MNITTANRCLNLLYNSGNLTLIQVSEKREELDKLHEDEIQDFVEKLPNYKFFEKELIIKDERDNQIKDKEESQPRIYSSLTFGENLFTSILASVLLFIICYFFASLAGNPFSFDNSYTSTIWFLYLCIIILIEYWLYKLRNGHKFFNKPLHKILYYISIILTIVAFIFFFLSLKAQYGGSQIAKSTKDGFIFNVFLIIFLAPTISWIIYILAIKKSDALTKAIKDSRKIKDERKQVVKRNEAVKQLKEAKELLDLGVLNQAEYDELTKKLKPIILNT
mgnify:CR=1 FL=1|tara:strand:- start:302 stop:1135 length:834 start_codon:yes stop_codon:yes gene_type:complete